MQCGLCERTIEEEETRNLGKKAINNLCERSKSLTLRIHRRKVFRNDNVIVHTYCFTTFSVCTTKESWESFVEKKSTIISR